MIEDGDRFYTVSPSTGRRADVMPDDCNIRACLHETIRSSADALPGNKLDNLQTCYVSE